MPRLALPTSSVSARKAAARIDPREALYADVVSDVAAENDYTRQQIAKQTPRRSDVHVADASRDRTE